MTRKGRNNEIFYPRADTLRVPRRRVLHLFRQFTVHREPPRGRPISYIATQAEKLEQRRARRSQRREKTLREVEELRASPPSVDQILQTIGKYIHDNRARPSSVPRRCDMPRGISIISGWYATSEHSIRSIFLV